MNDLVLMDGKKAYTTSRIIAKGCGVDHVATIQLVRRYAEDLNDIGSSKFQMGKFSTRGRPGEEALLDEVQATFLITLMKNSKTVVKFKKNLTKEFYRQRQIISNLITQRKEESWQNIRKDGKHVYFQKTSVIKDFVEYATKQGSTSAHRYYTNLAKMENTALFFFEGRYKNMREVLTIKQLMQVATADDVIEKALKEGMDEELPYKDCYKLAKERIVAFAEIIGKSPVLALAIIKQKE